MCDPASATLSKVQCSLLLHALTQFPNCRRVVYSTCSVFEVENEDVVAFVLKDERVVSAGGWQLSRIMPDTWVTRGRRLARHGELPLERCLRCDPNVDKTHGFFVARFDRDL